MLKKLDEVEHRWATIKARSTKGTTGTQASFLELFQGDHEKVKKLEAELRRKEKALAETAALLTLSKKAEAIWGPKDEDE